MTKTRLWSLAVGTAVALTSTQNVGMAQTAKSEAKTARTKAAASTKGDDAKAADTAKGGPGNIMDNPSAQLRMLRSMIGVSSGMGGPGGMMGGRGGMGGVGITSLLMQSPELQDAIEMTDAQKEALKKVNDEATKKRNEFFTQMRNNGGGGPGGGAAANGGGRGNQGGGGANGGGANGGGRGNQGGGGGNQGGGGGRGGFDPQVMRDAMTEMSQVTERGVNKILKPAQRKRLDQIALQIEGVQAVGRPEIAQKINMSEEQLEQVQAILEGLRTAQREVMTKSFQSMRGMFGGGGGPGAGPGGANGGRGQAQDTAKADATTKKAAPKSDEEDEETPKAAATTKGGRGNRPDPNSPEGKAAREKMNETMTAVNEESEKLEKQAEAQIGKVLTKLQKGAFNRLLGAKFDLTKITIQNNRGPGGPGGFGGGGPGGGGPGGGPGGPGGGGPGGGGRGNNGGAAPKGNPDAAE